VQAAAGAGIPLRGLSSYALRTKAQSALVLGFAGLPDEKLAQAVHALRTAWNL